MKESILKALYFRRGHLGRIMKEGLAATGPGERPYSKEVEQECAEMDALIRVFESMHDSHIGDPCVKCGIPHDAVPVGSCKPGARVLSAQDLSRAAEEWVIEPHETAEESAEWQNLDLFLQLAEAFKAGWRHAGGVVIRPRVAPNTDSEHG